MRRLVRLLLPILMVLPLTACGASANRVGEASSISPSTGGALNVSNRRFKRSAYLVLEVDDEDLIPKTLKRVEALASTHKGYALRSSSNSITIKVPTEKTEAVADEIGTFGELTRRDLNVTDVTAQYVDTELRVQNLQALRDRMQNLLGKAEQVKDLIELEKELGRITSELEALKGQLNLLKNETAFGTITVRVEETVSPGPVGWVFYGLYRGVKWLFVWD